MGYIIQFNDLPNGSYQSFDPLEDALVFAEIHASDVAVIPLGTNLQVTAAGKTVYLINVSLGQIAGSNFSFYYGYGDFLVGDRLVSTTDDDHANVLAGGVENDHLIGMGGNDTLRGNGGNDVLAGWWGNDQLDGGSGADTMVGGTGDDVYVVDSSGDVVTETSAYDYDRVLSSVSRTLGVGQEELDLTGTALYGTGNDLNNVIKGNAAANVLNGRGGTDTLAGALGNDEYLVDVAGDVVTELAGEGFDQVNSRASYVLPVNVEHLTLVGAAPISGVGNGSANSLTGNSAGNFLQGLSGSDKLAGNGGNDRLEGDLGNDLLTGGAGADCFRFDTAPDATTNRDTISDFKAVADVIQLENKIFAKFAVSGPLASVAFWKSATATGAHDGSDRIIYNTTTGALYYDPDGTGALAKVQFATLTGSPDDVTNVDFVVT